MMKVNEMVIYVSEMKWDLHDNHSHQDDMDFVDMSEIDDASLKRDEKDLRL